MPRDIPVGNGRLLLCFDESYCIRDLYFPHVGQENHIGGGFCRLGTWVDKRFSWVGKDWKRDLLYIPDTLVTQVNLYHEGLALLLVCRDAYSCVWPRDGALVANALDLAGYLIPAQNFYRFAADVIEREGYLLHKYNPNGTLASSWHPWFSGGKAQLPIQEDETALVIWALWNHFVLYRDIEFIKPLYRSLIKRAADFMCQYRDLETGLPSESYDLWER